jgi:hypothetical protein
LKPNCPGMIIGRSSTNFCFICIAIGDPVIKKGGLESH